MVTAVVEDLVAVQKIIDAGKSVGIDIRMLNPRKVDINDSLFLVDYVHPYGIYAARTIKNANPSAKVIGFYPHVRAYIKDEVEKIGCMALTNAEFFAKLKDIVKGKV